MFWKILIFGGFAIVVIAVAVPELNRWYARLVTQSEEVAVMRGSSADTEKTLEIVTLLGFDAIPAIVEPRFVSAAEAEAWMLPDELEKSALRPCSDSGAEGPPSRQR